MTPAPLAVRSPFRAEHVAMALAGTALTVLVVLPLVSLVVASLTDEGRLTLGHFRDALSRRLYVQALKNSLILGAWTALLSVAIGLPMAWAVSRTDVPAKALHPRHRDDRVPHAALPHRDRLREPLQPERGTREPVAP